MRKGKTILLTVLACLMIGASAGQGHRLAGMRGEQRFVDLRDAPPLMVFTTVVLGGFKGIVADVLWLRASLLQDEGRYFELVQLADWITALEPGIDEVWTFHAWNMTYNISVMMPREEDRWRWVLNGMTLLRDQGIRYNPSSPQLYFELGWIFQNKMGESIDAMHLYYKMQWAAAIGPLLNADGTVDYERLSEETSGRLLAEFALDAKRMQQIDALYGPLDWRLPEANAVYWGYTGSTVAGGKGYMPCDRVVYQSLMQLFRRGDLEFDANRKIYRVRMDPGMLRGTMQAFEDTIALHPDDTSVPHSYSLFLREAVRRLHDAGFDKEAMVAFEKVAAMHGDADTAGGYDAFLDFKYE